MSRDIIIGLYTNKGLESEIRGEYMEAGNFNVNSKIHVRNVGMGDRTIAEFIKDLCETDDVSNGKYEIRINVGEER